MVITWKEFNDLKGSGKMSFLMSKVLSLKKEIENLNIKTDEDNKVILSQISEILCEMAKKVDKVDENITEINEYVTVLDENLGNVEEEVYGFENEDEEFDGHDYVDIICKKCNEVLAVEREIFNNEDKIICPNCHNSINLKENNN